jgi:hypothetical protein
MDPTSIDIMARGLERRAPRRAALGVLGGLAALLTRLGIVGIDARKNKKGKEKLKRNAFGCVNVGAGCRGKDANCCSGICQGKKPRKGQKDKSRCVAHNTGSCTPQRSLCVTGSAVSYCTPGEFDAVCVATTGNAGYCASNVGLTADNCRVCRTDPECEAAGFPAGSACVILTGVGCVGPSDCNGVNGSQGTACVPPGA